ncbi:MAG TPA: ABC transporter ATP-binding protein [Phycisphaerales bacterium]|nr:ABC transporter ATP-binding protein [Phycisphaerales bacterium]
MPTSEAAKSSASAPPIHIQGLKKNYELGNRVVPALRGIDLTISDSGFYAIMGPSGSGKSTLLHLMAALDHPDEGAIEISGRRIDGLSEAQLTLFRRRHIGIIFQQFNLISTLTALENITLPAMLDGVSVAERNDRARTLLAALGIADRADHRPDALSGGEQQRVAIARALIFEPSVVFADEPTGNLDSNTSRQMWELLGKIAADRHLTVVMVTHEPTAAAYCRKVFVLSDGLIASAFDVDGMDAAQLAIRAQQSYR